MTKVKKLTEILISLTDNKTLEEKEAIIRSFLIILKQKKKIHLAKQILREVRREKEKKELVLTLAKEIDENLFREMKEKLRDFFGRGPARNALGPPDFARERTRWRAGIADAGGEELKIKIDENIIAGFVAKSQNYIIDASVGGLINKLKTKT